MGRFILKLFLFFFLVGVSDYICGIFFDSLRTNSKGGDTQRSEEINMHVESDVILMGASTCLLHYDPNVMEDSLGLTVYNCGEGGHGIIYEYGRLNLMLRRYKPKYIVYTLIEGFDLLQGEPNEKFLGRLRPYYNIEPQVDSIFYDIDPNEKYKLKSFAYRYNSKFLQYMSDYISPHRSYIKGYKYMNGVLSYEPTSKSNIRKTIDYDSVKLKYLRMFIQKCKNNYIPLIFIVTPFYNAKKPEGGSAYDIVKLMAKENNIPFFNEKYNEQFCLKRELYADPCHFNREGSFLFSQYISGKIRDVIINSDKLEESY